MVTREQPDAHSTEKYCPELEAKGKWSYMTPGLPEESSVKGIFIVFIWGKTIPAATTILSNNYQIGGGLSLLLFRIEMNIVKLCPIMLLLNVLKSNP